MEDIDNKKERGRYPLYNISTHTTGDFVLVLLLLGSEVHPILSGERQGFVGSLAHFDEVPTLVQPGSKLLIQLPTLETLRSIIEHSDKLP
jgi:hypothetical protein